jgi:hypothetical protein
MELSYLDFIPTFIIVSMNLVIWFFIIYALTKLYKKHLAKK